MKIVIFLLLSITGNLLAVDFGEVKDFNPTTKSITVRHVSPAAFRPGQTLYIFRDKKEIGQMNVGMVHFSSLNGKLISGDPKDKDLVIINQTDIGKIAGLKPESVSFKDIGSIAKMWIIKANYSLKSLEQQTRPLAFLDIIGARETGKNYYSQFPVKDIDSIVMEWDGTNFRGKSVQLKNRKKFLIDEVLSSNIHKKLAPRDATEKADCVIKFVKSQETSRDIPDTLKLKVKIEDAKSEYGEKHFFLKAYSNSIYLDEFYIDPNKIAKDIFEGEYHIPMYLLTPGINKLELYVSESEDSSGNFEKGESRLIAGKEMDVKDGDFKLEIQLLGDGKKFKIGK
ncbi:MAG: hypothetical protein L6Q54_01575 [Leptospiraceae bacterium]|nr:hypothetical protein [Leptospiraceae bacterium]MCK6379928.1 hypothetical protein [Leptospiraceae bacterium]